VLARLVIGGVDLKYRYLEQLVERTQVSEFMDRFEVQRLLMPHRQELLEWVYDTIAESCRSRGIHSMWIYLPMIEGTDSMSVEAARFSETARRAGFASVHDFSEVMRDNPPEVTWLAYPRDYHLSVQGHRMVADLLFEGIVTDPGLRRLMASRLTSDTP
jgi:hypothetical protein